MEDEFTSKQKSAIKEMMRGWGYTREEAESFARDLKAEMSGTNRWRMITVANMLATGRFRQ